MFICMFGFILIFPVIRFVICIFIVYLSSLNRLVDLALGCAVCLRFHYYFIFLIFIISFMFLYFLNQFSLLFEFICSFHFQSNFCFDFHFHGHFTFQFPWRIVHSLFMFLVIFIFICRVQLIFSLLAFILNCGILSIIIHISILV